VLRTGNIVVTDASGAGAVFLYNGETGALISSLYGGFIYMVTPLTNGNFVAYNPAGGSVTWCSGTTGLSGTVSVSNSLIAGGSPAPQASPKTSVIY